MSYYLPILLLVLFASQPAQESPIELSSGFRMQRAIRAGERHFYTIRLHKGDYSRAVVLQNGIDLVVTGLRPSGEKIVEMDSPNGTSGKEQVTLLADVAGVYRLEVALLDQKATGGSYELMLEPIRPLTEADRRVAAAEKLFAEATLLNTSSSRDDLSRALEIYAKAASEAQLGGDRLLEAYSHYMCGVLYKRLGEHLRGVEALQKSIDIYSRASSLHDEARGLYEQGDGWRYSGVNGRQDKAIVCYDRAAVLFEKVGDTVHHALAVNRIGLMLEEQNKYREALERYDQAIAIFRKLPSPHQNLPVVLNNRANLHIVLWNEKEAEAALKEALEIALVVQQPMEEAKVYMLWGRLEMGRYRMNAADEYFRRAIAKYEQLGNRDKAIATMKFSGLNFFYNGEYDKALALLEGLPQLADSKRNASVSAEAMLITAIIKQERGEVDKALALLNTALKLAHESGLTASEFSVLFSLTTVYMSLGDYVSVIQRAEEAGRLAGNDTNELLCLSYKGTALEKLGRVEEARQVFEEIFNRIGKVSDPIVLPIILNNSGYYYQRTGNLRRSIELFEQGIEKLKGSPNAHNLCLIYNNLARSYLLQGELERAENTSKRSYEIIDATGNNGQKAIYYFNMAEISYRRNHLKEALGYIERAIEFLEQFREGVSGQELRATFFARTRMIYELYVEILMKIGGERQIAKALTVSERARARMLLDMLLISRADIRQGIIPELHEQELKFKRKLSDLAQQQVKLTTRKAPKEVVSALIEEVARVQQEYLVLQTQIRTESPAYAALTQPLQIDLDRIRREVIDSDTALLEYMLTERQSYLWVVTSDSLQVYELPSRSEIERIARPLYDAIAHRGSQKRNLTVVGEQSRRYDLLALELSRAVLLPALKGLKQKRLLIAADGVLHYIPFAMLLLANQQELITRYELINIPSALTLAVMRQERHKRMPQKQMIVIADPVFEPSDLRVIQSLSVRKQQPKKELLNDLALSTVRSTVDTIPRLPGTRLEASRIKALFRSEDVTEVTDFDASRELAMSNKMADYRMIHFATHGFVNTERPELSGLVLSLVDRDGNSQQGYLLLQDIYNLSLPADLVVLSACQTGLGKEIQGEGLVGLMRGFMHAGTRQVVVSLWSVSDEGTAELMTRFYRGYVKEKLSAAEALRRAQLSMLKEKRWRHPFFWAAFQLQGD